MKILTGLYSAFYSKRWYQSVYEANSKRCLLYLFVMLAIVWVIFTVRFSFNIQTMTQEAIQGFAKQLPTMAMSVDHQLKTQKPGRYFIYYPATKKLFAVIDTDDNRMNFGSSPAEVWVGAEQTLYKSHNGIRVWQYKDMQPGTISTENFSAYMGRFLNFFTRILIVIFYVVGLIVIYPISLILSWFFAPFLRSIARSLHLQLPITKARNLAITGMTPFWMVLGVLYLFKFLTPWTTIITLIILVLYPVYATMTCQKLLKKTQGA